jgi:hypothetical protein
LLLGAADRASGSAASLESMDISEFSLPSGRMARIRFVPHSVLEELRSLCVRAVDGRSVPSMKVNPPTFAFSQLLLLHRIRTGLALTNESIHSAWRAELRCDALPSVLAARHLRFAGERVEETKALLAAPSLESAQWCARQAANELLAATLCSVGSTDPRPEWHLRQLRASTPDLGEAEVARLIDAVCGWSSSSLERTQSLLKICEDLALAVIDRLPDVADYATGVLGGDPRQPRH